ncbi:palmitoyltransferase DHHC7, putative [Plasmodium vinckei]|uniref:Palmitoyltransferase DHHC7, putative n=1 Tax=Plasmodium vinckei TaxID=5860 RepID=A0A6V7T9B4_PLAVN|nr:palmitoyltransferase DHHC7, putative [Plasmodium vinckei]
MFKLKGKKKNNTLDNEILENGDSSSSGKKKKNKNKNKNKRNDEDRKYSIDKNVLNIEKNKNDNDMLDSVEVNDTGNIISDDTNENYGKTCKKQNEKNKFVHLLPVFFIFILLFGIYFIYIMYDCIPLVVRSYKKVYINYDMNCVIEAINHNETPFNDLFLLLFGETLNSFLALIVTCFLFFHLWLTFKNMTTIEFCEKRTNYHNQSYSKFYNKGLYKNLKEVFGESPFLWLLPINNKKDDIVYFSKGNNKEYAANNIEETIPININI